MAKKKKTTRTKAKAKPPKAKAKAPVSKPKAKPAQSKARATAKADTTTPARKRGRPPKPAPEAAKPKRPRGRPPKPRTDEDKKPRRPRGRPPKPRTEAELAKPKRPRGRPRKNPVEPQPKKIPARTPKKKTAMTQKPDEPGKNALPQKPEEPLEPKVIGTLASRRGQPPALIREILSSLPQKRLLSPLSKLGEPPRPPQPVVPADHPGGEASHEPMKTLESFDSPAQPAHTSESPSLIEEKQPARIEAENVVTETDFLVEDEKDPDDQDALVEESESADEDEYTDELRLLDGDDEPSPEPEFSHEDDEEPEEPEEPEDAMSQAAVAPVFLDSGRKKKNGRVPTSLSTSELSRLRARELSAALAHEIDVLEEELGRIFERMHQQYLGQLGLLRSAVEEKTGKMRGTEAMALAIRLERTAKRLSEFRSKKKHTPEDLIEFSKRLRKAIKRIERR